MPEHQKDPETWLRAFYAAGDALDPQPWLSAYWTEDASLDFGGQPPIKGAINIQQFFASRFEALKSMKHTIVSMDVFPNKLYHEALVTYVLKGDVEDITLRACTVFGKAIDEDRISFSHSYMDAGPLMARMRWLKEQKK